MYSDPLLLRAGTTKPLGCFVILWRDRTVRPGANRADSSLGGPGKPAGGMWGAQPKTVAIVLQARTPAAEPPSTYVIPAPSIHEAGTGMMCVWAARTTRRRTSNRAWLLTPRRGSVLEREWAGTLITSPSLPCKGVRPADRTLITRSLGPWPLSPCLRAIDGATLISRSSSGVTVLRSDHPACAGA